MVLRQARYQSGKSSHNNSFDSMADDSKEDKIVRQNGHSLQRLSRNFQVLQQFLGGMKTEGDQKGQSKEETMHEFKEQWQNKRKQKYQFKYSYFFRQNRVFLLFSLILMICQIVLLWFLSVFRVFKCEDNQYVFQLCLVVQIMDLVMKSSYLVNLKRQQQNQNLFKIDIHDWIQIYLGNLYCIIYSILGISSAISSVESHTFLLLDIVAIAFIYIRMGKIQNDIKIFKSTVQFKSYIKLFNLMSTLIMIIHFFAVMMYYSTNFTHINFLADDQLIGDKTWINLYVYSFYFSGTTVLTVGYGDILPRNIVEIFIVLLMQIFGVVMTVYFNGEVGNILCSLRREKQNLENDLSVLQRLKSSFSLSLQTTQKIRQFLIDNRRADQENNVHEEKALLGKISSGLRQEATLTNHVNIIKQSLFLLQNFSTKAHISISNKLISRIYSPNECINQIVGQQKLFFIKKGNVCFYITKKDSESSNSRKIVKQISVTKNEQPHCNCFGYVSLIMGKQNRLKAFSKDFSDCYSIDKQQFIETINCDNQDFQKFHEMRENYITDRNPETYEASDFFSQKDHYVCEGSKVIAEYLKMRFHSKRRNVLRIFKRKKLIIEMAKGDPHFIETESESERESIPKAKTDESRSNMCLSLKERKKKYEGVSEKSMAGSGPKNFVVQRKYVRRYCKKPTLNEDYEGSDKTIPPPKLPETEPFEVVSSYNFFYPDSNIEIVAGKMNYYLQVLAIFTNMFEKTLEGVNKRKTSTNINDPNNILGSMTNIQEFRRHKDFINSISRKR